MRFSNAHWHRWTPVFLLIVQLLLCAIAFKDFRISPREVAFSNIGDGLKNNFTLLQYVKEPIGPEGFLHFRSFNYPHGDVVWFTDNTPIFAVPFKAFCHYIYDLSDDTLPFYFLFILLNIPVCALFGYKIFLRLTRSPGWAFACSLLLPWLIPMLLRIPRGHYNLSVSALLVANVWFLMDWHRRLQEGRLLYPATLRLIATIFIGFLFHAYYLAILAVFTGLFFLAYALFEKDLRRRLQGLKAAFLIPGIPGILCIGLVALTDPFRAIRHHEGMGYDWMEIKTRFTSLFSAYSFIDTPFPISGKLYYDEPERAAYLGTGVLMAMLFYAFWAVCSKDFRKRFRKTQAFIFKNAFARALGGAAFLMLMISFGEHYYTTDDAQGLHFINLLNPLYYLHKITHQIEHFRALGRFVWPFWLLFFTWVIVSVFLLSRSGRRSKPAWRLIPAALLLIFSFTDLRSTIDWMQGAASKENALSPSLVAKAVDGLPKPSDSYAAILPLPLYNVGSESKDLTIDDRDEWSRQTFQWSVGTGLPLLACKMSRTPVAFAQELVAFVAHDSLSAGLYDALQNRPVLIALHRDLAADSSFRPINSESAVAKDLYLSTLKFAERHGLQPIDSAGPVLFYAWQPPAIRP